MLGVGREEEMGESFPLDGFQWLEQIKGHSCFTFNWKQPNCKIKPGSTCVHDDSIVAGFSESALTFCHVPSPDVLHTVPLARRTCSTALFHQAALSEDVISAAFFQNLGIQDELNNSAQVFMSACLRVWEFVVNSQSSAGEINYPCSFMLELPGPAEATCLCFCNLFLSFCLKQRASSLPSPAASHRCDPGSAAHCCLSVEAFAALGMLSPSPWDESTLHPHGDAAISLHQDP